jgi:hypothetical protein
VDAEEVEIDDVRMLVAVVVEVVLESVLIVDVRVVVAVVIEVLLERVPVADARVVVVVVVVVVTTVVEVGVLLVGPGELLDESGRVLGELERGRDDTGKVLDKCALELEGGLAALDNVEVDEAEDDPMIDEDIIDAGELDGPTDVALPVEVE